MNTETIEEKYYRIATRVLAEQHPNEKPMLINDQDNDPVVMNFYCRVIELIIAEEREASGWQDIATAPKDDTAVLGYQLVHEELWVIAPMYFLEGNWVLVSFHAHNTEFKMKPTHWMPIPPPPVAPKGMSDQEDQTNTDEMSRYFGMGQDGNPTEVIIVEYKSGNIGIELNTKRDGMEQLVASVELNPNTFSLLFEAMFRATNGQAKWYTPATKKDEVSE